MKAATLTSASLALLLGVLPAAAHADFVTYSWVTDTFLGQQPNHATFQVELAKVQAGTFGSFDILNIDFSFPTIDPLPFTIGSSIGSDNAAFVDPITGLPVFHSPNQGLAAIGYNDMLFGNVFLSILFGNPVGSNVDDTFNAINQGPGSLGFGHGHWTAEFPSAVPEPASMLLILPAAVGLFAFAKRRKRRGRRHSGSRQASLPE